MVFRMRADRKNLLTPNKIINREQVCDSVPIE